MDDYSQVIRTAQEMTDEAEKLAVSKPLGWEDELNELLVRRHAVIQQLFADTAPRPPAESLRSFVQDILRKDDALLQLIEENRQVLLREHSLLNQGRQALAAYNIN